MTTPFVPLLKILNAYRRSSQPEKPAEEIKSEIMSKIVSPTRRG